MPFYLGLGLLASGLLRFLYQLGGFGCSLALLRLRARRSLSDLSRLRLGGGRGGGFAWFATILLGGLGGLGCWDFLLRLLWDGVLLLELLGNGILIIASSFLNVARGGHLDVEVISILDGLLVGHVLGVGVAVLVRVHTGVVEAEVVLVGVVPASLLGSTHDGPAALTLLLNGTFRRILTKVVGNDGTSSLHVEEVRSQGTLGRVGIMSALLPLLLLLNGGLLGYRERCRDQSSKSVADLIKVTSIFQIGSLAQEKIGLAKIILREALDKILDGQEALIDLWRC